MSYKLSVAAVVCVLAVFTVHAQPVVVVDSLLGQAEVKRAGQLKWALIKKGDELHNNDMLRVLQGSAARLKWPLKNIIYVKANSQVRINVFDNAPERSITQHITVFFGALYFVVRKSLPRGVVEKDNLKVFTPTSIISVRGTSFSVVVDKDSGKTTVSVTSGSVLVRNIISSSSVFVGESFKTTIEVNKEPLAPRPILTADIETLKTWVPSAVVDEALAGRQAQPVLDSIRDINEHKGIIVVPFVNKSTYIEPWKIGREIAGEMVLRLRDSDSLLLVTLGEENIADPLEYGVRAGARYVISGAVRELDITRNARLSPDLEKYAEFSIGRITLHVQLIDIADKKIIHEEEFISEVDDADVRANTWKRIGQMTFNLHDPQFASSVLGKAVMRVIVQSTTVFGGYLSGR